MPFPTPPPKNRIAFALNTMERTQLTEKVLPGLDCGGFDLIWCDGSKTPEGKEFPSQRHFKKTPLTEIHYGVNGGPDVAIQYSLRRLLARGYDYVGLIENDIELKPGWLEAMMSAWQAAQKDGFNVGAVTARTAASRVLAAGTNYATLWNLGAGMSLFSRAGAEAALADNHLTSAKEMHEFYLSRFGIDIRDAWELFMDKPDRGLGADWYYAPAMLQQGLVALGVVPNHAENIDVDFEKVCGTQFIRSPNQPLPAHCVTPQKLLAAIQQNSTVAPGGVPLGKPKVAEDFSHGKDLMSVQNHSEFEHFLRDIIKKTKPRFIVETGTYLGQGTTRILSSALKENHLESARFYSIECNPEHHRQALVNLNTSGLLRFVRLLHGVSVPRSLLPDANAIRKETIENARNDIFVDHHEEKRIQLYFNETNYPHLPDDLLGRCLRECDGKPDLLLLDSAGHMGHVEFNYVLKLLRGPCYIALDDIRHVKHARSVEQMKKDPRFEILAVTEEKFGSLLARFTPLATVEIQAGPQRILFVRTDSIGDAIMASSMLGPIREKYPQAKLAVLCQQHVADLFVACPYVDSIICYERKKMELPAERGEILGEIASFNPDLILNSVRSRDRLSNEMTLMFREAQHIAIEGDLSNISPPDHQKSLSGYERIIPSPGAHKPEAGRHADFLRGLGIETGPLQSVVWTAPADEELAENFFKQEKLDPQRTMALFPFTQHTCKDYPAFPEAFKAFGHWNFLIFGGPETQKPCGDLAKQLPGHVWNLSGRTGLRQMAALIRRCRLLVGSDSCGPHVACAVGMPNVVVLGGGHFGRFLPYSPLTSAVSLPLECFGCNWNCRYSRPHCVKDLSPAILAEAIRQTLDRKSKHPRFFLQGANPGQAQDASPAWQYHNLVASGCDVQIIETDAGPLEPKHAGVKRRIVPVNHEHVDCPACGGQEASRVRNSADIVQCSQCGLTYLRTRLTREAMHKLYQSYAHERSHMALPKSLNEAEQSPLNRDYFLNEIVQFTPQEGEFLDVGCGWGAFLLKARAKGFRPRGIELTGACIEYANKELGIPVVDVQLENAEITTGSLKVVTMNHVLEHLPGLRNSLKKTFDSLEPGGMFCGVVPNFASFCSETLKEKWYWLDPNYHYQHFTPATLAKILANAGFIVEKIYTTTGDYGPDAVRKACQEQNPKMADDSFFATELARYESDGRGEEIRFFARKPVEAAAPKNLGTPIEECLLIPETVTGPDPLVSVVVSTYKSEEFIRPCLENLSRQTIFDRCEIIVVDSGSPENERAIVAEFQQRFPNIRYVRTPRETLYAAWNRGLALARGRYWANANTDDALRDDALEILAASLDKHPECAQAYADTAWTTRPNDTFPSSHIIRTVKYPHYAPIYTLFYCMTACLQFYRTECLRLVGGFDASLKAAGDYEATLKMMTSGFNAVHVPEALSLFYQNTAGLTQGGNNAADEHLQVMNHYRSKLDIAKVFQIPANDARTAAHAWTALGAFALKFSVPWEDQTFTHNDFAMNCLVKALDADPQNKAAGVFLASLSRKMGRLDFDEPNMLRRWPKIRDWINLARGGEDPILPHVRLKVVGPVYRRFEWQHRPTEEQLSQEPAALRLWICRIEGRNVHLSEDLFPLPTGLRYSQEELQQASRRLLALLKELPPFYAHLGGAGDALLLLASFYDQKPDSVVFSYPNGIGAAKALFDAFPKLSKIYYLPQHTEPYFHGILRYIVYELKNCLGAGTTPQHGYDQEWKASLDLGKKYKVNKSPRWIEDWRKNTGSRRIALAPKGSLSGMVGSKRNLILPEYWPQIIAHIQERGFEPVIFGVPNEAKEFPALPRCIDLRHESFPGQMRAIGECVGLVGADSWAKTFSALTKIPTIVFEPIKGADLANWKDPADWVFIEPWPAIKMVRSLDTFRAAFDARIAKIPGAVLPDISKAAIAWEGSFLDYGSLSHINRELTSRLTGLQVTCVGPNYLPAAAKSDPSLAQCAKKLAAKAPAHTAVTVRHQWPPNWSKPASGLLVVIQPWEFGSLPKSWLEQAQNVDEFWVPSPIVRAMYTRSGIAPEKVRVIPNGVDIRRFRPGITPFKLATKKKFKFLFVGGTIYRKGPDVLLEAFSRAFTATDDVCLVIKDFGGSNIYQGQTAETAIQALQQKTGAPEILYLKDEISSDQMPSLYAACDCLVLPYRGEGFGMPVLEAMACGLPVIVTDGGATDSFVTPDAGWKIPSSILGLSDRVGDIPLVKPGWMLQPSKPHLVEILKQAAGHPQECRRRGANGRAIAERRFDWSDIAAEVNFRLKELAQRAPVLGAQNIQPPSRLKKAATQPAVIKLPDVAHIGQLNEARELLKQKNLPGAWEATLTAISRRPCHPEAYLLLAEIAAVAGDSESAKRCAQYARDLAPAWGPVKKFLQNVRKSNTKPEWLKLPDTVQHPKAQTLSVCLITKNEEKFLAQCLKSIRDVAQQIIVVDTGSTDATVKIAKEFGADVHSFKWCEDFSAARNAALEHATGDWVLILDADEEIPAGQHANLLADMKKPDVTAFRLPLVNRGQEASGRNFVPRLFRNAPGVYFFGRVHEQAFPSLLPLCKVWGTGTAMGTAEILHHGYTQETMQARNKVERNLKLLREANQEMPGDVILTMNLGLELVRSGDLAGGVAKYREAYELMSRLPSHEVTPECREVLLTQFTSQLYKINAHQEVVHVLNSPLAKAGGLTPSMHLALGLSFFAIGNFREAVDQIQKCLAGRKQSALSPINTDILTSMPNHCLALALMKMNDAAGAEKAFAMALTESGRGEDVKLDYAKFLSSTNRPLDALHQLRELISANGRNVAAWRLGGEISLSRPEFLDFARDWTGEAMRHVADDIIVVAQRAEALLLRGDTAGAVEMWERAWNTERNPRSLAGLILCQTIELPTTHAPDEGLDEIAASRAFIVWYQRLITMRAKTVVNRLNEQTDKLSRALPTAAGMIEKALVESQTRAAAAT